MPLGVVADTRLRRASRQCASALAKRLSGGRQLREGEELWMVAGGRWPVTGDW